MIWNNFHGFMINSLGIVVCFINTAMLDTFYQVHEKHISGFSEKIFYNSIIWYF